MSTDSTPDRRVAGIASRQAGCVARAQARELGVTDNMITHRLNAGRWTRLYPGVYRIEGAPLSWLQEVWAAVLTVGPEAVVSHHSALILRGLPDSQARRRPIMLSVPAGRHHRVAGATVFQRSDLRIDHVTTLEGLAVTSLERSIVDLAALRAPHSHIGKVLDRFIADGQTTLSRVGRCFDDIAKPGKRGLSLFAAVLDERGPGYVPPESRLEEMFFAALARAQLPEPVRQLLLPGRGRVEGVADAGYLDARMLMEVDGRRYHTRLDDFRKDRERDAEASRAGYATLRFCYEQVRDEPDEIAATVAETRAIRLQQFTGHLLHSPAFEGDLQRDSCGVPSELLPSR